MKGSKKGQTEVLVNLPGFPDNIRISDHKTLFVGFAATRHPSKPVLLDLLGEYPLIRNMFTVCIILIFEIILLYAYIINYFKSFCFKHKLIFFF